MLPNRIRSIIDTLLRKKQHGFRTNRSTTGQILTIRRQIEKGKTNTFLRQNHNDTFSKELRNTIGNHKWYHDTV